MVLVQWWWGWKQGPTFCFKLDKLWNMKPPKAAKQIKGCNVSWSVNPWRLNRMVRRQQGGSINVRERNFWCVPREAFVTVGWGLLFPGPFPVHHLLPMTIGKASPKISLLLFARLAYGLLFIKKTVLNPHNDNRGMCGLKFLGLSMYEQCILTAIHRWFELLVLVDTIITQHTWATQL